MVAKVAQNEARLFKTIALVPLLTVMKVLVQSVTVFIWMTGSAPVTVTNLSQRNALFLWMTAPGPVTEMSVSQSTNLLSDTVALVPVMLMLAPSSFRIMEQRVTRASLPCTRTTLSSH